MKSMMRRPSEKRPVGWWKKVLPYGGNATGGGFLGSKRPTTFPVSAVESPKLMIDLKFRHCDSDLTILTRRVDKKRLPSFINILESRNAMREVPSDFLISIYLSIVSTFNYFILTFIFRIFCFVFEKTKFFCCEVPTSHGLNETFLVGLYK